MGAMWILRATTRRARKRQNPHQKHDLFVCYLYPLLTGSQVFRSKYQKWCRFLCVPKFHQLTPYNTRYNFHLHCKDQFALGLDFGPLLDRQFEIGCVAGRHTFRLLRGKKRYSRFLCLFAGPRIIAQNDVINAKNTWSRIRETSCGFLQTPGCKMSIKAHKIVPSLSQVLKAF